MARHEQLLGALQNLAELSSQVGAKKEATAFERLRKRLEEEGKLAKDLKDQIFKTRGLASFWIPTLLYSSSEDMTKSQQQLRGLG